MFVVLSGHSRDNSRSPLTVLVRWIACKGRLSFNPSNRVALLAGAPSLHVNRSLELSYVLFVIKLKYFQIKTRSAKTIERETTINKTNSSKVHVSLYYMVSIKHRPRTTDYGLRTGYKTRTRYKMWTKHYGLGIKYGLRHKTWTEHYRLSIKHEERSTLTKFSHERFYKWNLLISRKSPLIQV